MLGAGGLRKWVSQEWRNHLEGTGSWQFLVGNETIESRLGSGSSNDPEKEQQ